MEETVIPVYVFLGFLDSGKTTFITPLVMGTDFTQDEKTLLILTEEGEVEYNVQGAAKQNVAVEVIDDEEEFNELTLMQLAEKHRPTQVVIEYNGMWLIETLNRAICEPWRIYQVVTTVDARTFDMYSKNMSQLMMQHISNAGMVIFNRCTDELVTSLRARNLKMLNRRCDMYLEYENGRSDIYDDGTPPFDMSLPMLEIPDEDYGVWYVDAMDHPENYDGKEVSFLGMIAQSERFPKDCCAIGRFAMVCCAEDTTFLGVLLKGPETRELKTRQWVHVRAKVKLERNRFYRGKGPMLHVIEVTPAEAPENELIYF